MATVKAIIRKDKIKANGEAPIYLRITQDRKSIFKSLGLFVHPEYWDEDKEQIKKNNKIKGYVRINNYIINHKAGLQNKILETETKEKKVVHSKMNEIVKGVKSVNFFEYSDLYLKSIENTSKVRVYNQTKTILNKLAHFNESRELNFEDMTFSYLKRYQIFLSNRYKNKNNTIFTNLKVLRKLYYLAIQEDIIGEQLNPFRKIKFEWDATDTCYLTNDEIESLKGLSINPNIKDFHLRNIFIFATYTAGLRISDILNLKWENVINDERIIVFTQKTKTNVSIKLPSTALATLSIYRTKENKPKDFIFPFLENGVDYSDPKFFYKRISSITSYANKRLKEIAKLAKIEKHLHFHVSRHTFATRGLDIGMELIHISKLMGHSSVKMTENYAKIMNRQLDDAMDLLG